MRGKGGGHSLFFRFIWYHFYGLGKRGFWIARNAFFTLDLSNFFGAMHYVLLGVGMLIKHTFTFAQAPILS
jgi:hypothetical protein